MSNTIQLLFPQGQGGDNPDYLFGAELLSLIVPQNPTIKKFMYLWIKISQKN